MYLPIKRGSAVVQRFQQTPEIKTNVENKMVQSKQKPNNLRTGVSDPQQHRGGSGFDRQNIESFFLKLFNNTNSLVQPLMTLNIGNVFPNERKKTIRVQQAYFYYQATSLDQLPVSFAISAANVAGLKINYGPNVINTNLIAFLQPISIQEVVSQATGQPYYNVMYATKIPFIWQVGALTSTNFRFWAQTQVVPVIHDGDQPPPIPTYVQWPLVACPLSFKFDIVHQK